MSDNIFYKNLENIIKENKLEELNATQVFESIVYMRSAYDLFFFSKNSNSNEDEVYLYELDLVIMVIFNLLKILITDLSEKKLIIYYEDKEKPFGVVAIKLVEFLIHDIITMRNLFAQGLENQFLVIYRSFIEKLSIFYLFMYDYDFALIYAFNPDNLEGRKLYEKFTHPSQVKNRIVNNLKQIIDEENKSGRIYGRSDKFVYQHLMDTEKSRKFLYTLCNNFTHFSDGKSIMEYHLQEDDEGKVAFKIGTIANKKYETQSFRYHIRALLELLYFNQSMIMDTFQNRATTPKLTLTQLPRLIVGYLHILIDRNYNNRDI
jgi:hypothetical protein